MRGLVRKREILLILAALGAIAAFLLLRQAPGDAGTAHVSVNGAQVLTLPLGKTPDQRIDLGEYGVPAALEVADHKIRFVDVTCPDHICEKTGWVWKDGQTAVCMPNRAAITVTGP